MKKLMVFIFFWVQFAFAVAPDVGTPEQQELGKKTYSFRCSQCHGDAGDGKGVAYKRTKPWPRDFTKGVYKFKTTPDDRLPTTADIMNTIKHGNPHTVMPGWPMLTEQEVKNVAYYLKTFTSDFSDPDTLEDEAVAPIPLKDIPTSAPAWSQDSADKGKALFKENKCMDCHGLAGRGAGKSASEQSDMDGNQVRPRDLSKRWTFRNGHSRPEIFRTISTGLAPMPSFHNLSVEQRWNIVDYVYSLGDRDEPKYGTVVASQLMKKDLDITLGEKLFEQAPRVYLPVMGQVTQPGRAFYASANGVEVKSVYNQDEIAFLVVWHDMKAEITQSNAPDMEVPLFNDDSEKEKAGQYSDAIAIQIPSQQVKGAKKPYFIFGDKNMAVDLWFADLAHAKEAAQLYIAKGFKNIKKGDEEIQFKASYDEGRWVAIFKRKLKKEKGTSFAPAEFTPIAFSIWDGFNNERGNKRALTSWFHVYLQPEKNESALAMKVAMAGFLFILFEVTFVFFVRKKYSEI